jgi:hypothetical protein
VSFSNDVLPILQASCFECHRGTYTDASGRLRKPKGDLRLDGRAWIVKGGKDGSVLTPGKAQQSPLFTRTTLPADHDERMPATGEPLSAAATEVLRRWIDDGADFGDWTGEPGPESKAANVPDDTARTAVAPASTRTLDLARVAEGLAPLPASTLAQAAGTKAKITALWHGSPLLRVEFLGHEDEVADADVAALTPLRQHIAVLSLARTQVTDRACATVARMPRLVRLDLRETKIGDAGVAQLRGLAELTELNLFATAVTDASLAALQALPKLTALRLWQTKVTAAALAQLRATRPSLDVSGAPDLPAGAPAPAAPRGRRGR